MEIKEVKAKHILVKCGIPGIDYVINPYTGCSFACKYCYASFMGRFVGKQITDWGNYVYAKVNAPELLKNDLKILKNKGVGKEIFMSSVTDPYQGLEVKYKLTRKCLEILVDFEKFAPSVSQRFKALKELNKNGIETYAFIGPLLPHFVARPDELDRLFKKLKQTGTRDIFIEHLNLSTYIKTRLTEEMKGQEDSLLNEFYSSQSREYRAKLEEIIKGLVKKYDMHLLMDMVIFHKEFQERPNQGNMEKITK